MSIHLRLPPIRLELPEWNVERDFWQYRKDQESLTKIGRKVGRSSNLFNQSGKALMKLALNGNADKVGAAIRRNVDARALTYLWLHDELFWKRCPLSKDRLDALYHPRPTMSRLVFQQLLRLFFQRFDRIDDLDVLIRTLTDEVRRQGDNLSRGDISRLLTNAEALVSREGPVWVVSQAVTHEADLDHVVENLGLRSFADTRYHQICQFHYYLESLKRLNPGEDSPLLREVCKQDVYEAPYGNGQMLGHEILRLLIDRASESDITDPWQNVIMTIAGDPRVPTTSRKYQLWWSTLGEQRIRKVRGWLSRFDLLLFLKILEEYGESTRNQDMMRMFPARKQFLEGLFDAGLVADSRLFVNPRAEYYLKKHYDASELPVFAGVQDPNRSMIYLNVQGRHVIEGSHNFKLWIFEELPKDNVVQNYNHVQFHPSELSTKLEAIFFREFKGSNKSSPFSIVHSGNLNWQHKAIEAFKELGVKIDPEKVLTPSDYKVYKRKYGLG